MCEESSHVQALLSQILLVEKTVAFRAWQLRLKPVFCLHSSHNSKLTMAFFSTSMLWWNEPRFVSLFKPFCRWTPVFAKTCATRKFSPCCRSKCIESHNTCALQTKHISFIFLACVPDSVFVSSAVSMARDVVSVSTSRSRGVVSKRLGLVLVSWKCGKVSVSISSPTENQMSQSRLGLVP